jgi:3-deoxy-7-phosphoheptulonate synthase
MIGHQPTVLSPYLGTDHGAALQSLNNFELGISCEEIESLNAQMFASDGKNFFLCLGDCAERFSDCTYSSVIERLRLYYHAALLFKKISGKSVTILARAAGQYAKPRSNPTEQNGQDSIPSYFGDIINSKEICEEMRKPNPLRMIRAAIFSRTTILYMREALLEHEIDPQNSFLNSIPDGLSQKVVKAYELLKQALETGDDLSDNTSLQLGKNLFSAHEALMLPYEASMTRRNHEGGWYNKSAHFLWLGERTRAPQSAHSQYLRGIRNPIGIKVGPNANVVELVKLVEELNPTNECGKITLITRLGAANTEQKISEIVNAIRGAGLNTLFACDPMHGNTVVCSRTKLKTRKLTDIIAESQATIRILSSYGLSLSGLFLEAAGADVSECLSGEKPSLGEDLRRNYQTSVDPRLNYIQTMDVLERLGRELNSVTITSLGVCSDEK